MLIKSSKFLLGLLWDKIVMVRHIWRPSFVFFLLRRGRGWVGRRKNASKEWNVTNNNGTKVKQWQSESHFKSRFKCSNRFNPSPTCKIPKVVNGNYHKLWSWVNWACLTVVGVRVTSVRVASVRVAGVAHSRVGIGVRVDGADRAGDDWGVPGRIVAIGSEELLSGLLIMNFLFSEDNNGQGQQDEQALQNQAKIQLNVFEIRIFWQLTRYLNILRVDSDSIE